MKEEKKMKIHPTAKKPIPTNIKVGFVAAGMMAAILGGFSIYTVKDIAERRQIADSFQLNDKQFYLKDNMTYTKYDKLEKTLMKMQENGKISFRQECSIWATIADSVKKLAELKEKFNGKIPPIALLK